MKILLSHRSALMRMIMDLIHTLLCSPVKLDPYNDMCQVDCNYRSTDHERKYYLPSPHGPPFCSASWTTFSSSSCLAHRFSLLCCIAFSVSSQLFSFSPYRACNAASSCGSKLGCRHEEVLNQKLHLLGKKDTTLTSPRHPRCRLSTRRRCL